MRPRLGSFSVLGTLALLHGGLPALPGAALVAAQVAAEATAGVIWQSYRFGEKDRVGAEGVALLTIPVAFSARFGAATTLDVRGAWAAGTLDRGGGIRSEIAAPTDAELSLRHTLGRDAVVLGLVAFLPTGKATHDPEEAEVAAAVAAELLPFRVNHWGTGGGVGGSVAVARTVRGFGVGASAGYVVAGEFEPRAGESVVFQPGNLLRLAAVVDRTVGGASKTALRVGFQRHGEDAVEGTNLFRAGKRLEVIASHAFPAGGGSSAILYAGFLHREKGSFLTGVEEAPSQDLVVAGGGIRVPIGFGVFTPSADLRVHRRSDGIGQGWVGGIGASFEVPAGGAALIPTARVRMGSVEVRDGDSSGVLGLEAGALVRFGRVRR